MSPESFCYWLQGFFEMQEGEVELSPKQIQMVRDHLDLVFEKGRVVQKTRSTESALEKLLRGQQFYPRPPRYC